MNAGSMWRWSGGGEQVEWWWILMRQDKKGRGGRGRKGRQANYDLNNTATGIRRKQDPTSTLSTL